MKRLLFFLLSVIALSTFGYKIFAMHEIGVSQEGISAMKEEAKNLKNSLDEQQEKLQKQIETQRKKVENASEEEQQKEQDTLNKMHESLNKINKDATSLDQFINNQSVSQEDAKNAETTLDQSQEDLKEAKKLEEQLQSEFITNQQTQETDQQQAEAGQNDIKKSSTWQTFKQIAGKFFTELKLTFATLFGSPETVAAIRTDLNDIYENLKDYKSKQANLKELSSIYIELGNLAEAIKFQQLRLDTLFSEVEDKNYTENYKNSQTEVIATDIIANLLVFKDILAKNKLLFLTENIKNIDQVNETINDLLNQIGLKYEESYYSMLGISSTATPQEIENARTDFLKAWGRTDITTDQWEKIKNAYNIIGINSPELLVSLGLSSNATYQEIQSSYTTLTEEWTKARNKWSNTPISVFGSEKSKGEVYNTLSKEYLDKLDTLQQILAKADYDKSLIAKTGFEISPMSETEKQDFKNKKNQEQTTILDSNG